LCFGGYAAGEGDRKTRKGHFLMSCRCRSPGAIRRRKGNVMETKNKKVIRIVVLVVGFLPVLPLIVEARTVRLTCCGRRTITASVERLNPGDTLLVEGACVENVLIPEQVVDVILNGQGAATINGPDATKATITVRGRNITIQNFQSITGGRDGILVNRGGTA